MHDDNEDKGSRYPALAVPEFKSTIPQHLLGRLSDQERYICESLSRMEAQNNWLILSTMEGNRAVRELDQRVAINERWRSGLTNRWSVVLYIVVLFVPVFLKSLFDRYFRP